MAYKNYKAEAAYDRVKEIYDGAKKYDAHVPKDDFRKAMCALNEQGIPTTELNKVAGSISDLQRLQRGDLNPDGPTRDRMVRLAGKILRNQIIPGF